MRALVKVGRDSRYATYSDVVPVLERAVQTLPGKLRLRPAKALAENRVKVLAALLAAVRDEAGSWLC